MHAYREGGNSFDIPNIKICEGVNFPFFKPEIHKLHKGVGDNLIPAATDLSRYNRYRDSSAAKRSAIGVSVTGPRK